jgi:hypothetical protein
MKLPSAHRNWSVLMYNHSISALAVGDDEFKWGFITAGVVVSTPAIGADGTVGGEIFAVDTDGALQWSFSTDRDNEPGDETPTHPLPPPRGREPVTDHASVLRGHGPCAGSGGHPSGGCDGSVFVSSCTSCVGGHGGRAGSD